MFIWDESLGTKKDKLLLDAILAQLKTNDLRIILRSAINKLFVTAVLHQGHAKLIETEEGDLALEIREVGSAGPWYEQTEELIELYNTVDEWGY